MTAPPASRTSRLDVRPLASLALSVLVLALGTGSADRRLSTERFATHVAVLASDRMSGRGNGAPGLDRAADYLAAEFARSGLRAFGDDGSYFQEFPIAFDVAVHPANAMQINGVDQRPGVDYVPLPLSRSGSYDGPAVFVGDGITSPDLDWDDYAGIDVEGKAVVVLGSHPALRTTAGHSLGYLSSFEMKARNARRHGARAIIFVMDSGRHPDTTTGLDMSFIKPQDLGVIAVYAARRAVEPLFTAAGRPTARVMQPQGAAPRPGSFALTGSTVRVTVDAQRRTGRARNVVAMIPGHDASMRHEWLVVGAHYDHLGRDERHGASPAGKGRTHYGADDNASGTAGLLELARLLAREPSSLKRSIMFVAFAGEEIGLLGSWHLLEHPPVPLANIKAMINLDMIGRLSREPLSVIGGPVPSRFSEWIRRENQDVGLTLAFASGEYASSDWAGFQAMGVPALTFFTGLHEDYHRPSDRAEKINTPGALKVLSIVNGTLRRMAGAPFALTGGLSRRVSPEPEYGEAHLGAEPTPRHGSNGLRIANVERNGPAAKAGLRSGDVVLEFGEFPIRSVNDFNMALQSFRAGDMPAVNVRRRGRPMRLVVALE